VVNIPYNSLTPELTADYHERTSLNGFRFGFAVIGTIVGAAAVQPILGAFPNKSAGFSAVGAVLGLIMALSALITFFFGPGTGTFKGKNYPTRGFLVPTWGFLKIFPILSFLLRLPSIDGPEFSPGYSGFVNKVSDKIYDIGIMSNKITISPRSEIIQNFDVYLGPQDTQAIGQINPMWEAIVYFGRFDIVAQAIYGLLKFLYGIVKNWGIAIILLSIAIYLILFPLSVKQMRSVKEMQFLQPKIEQLRKQYGDNSKKLNDEIMNLYKQHKINPFSGCLPMLLQIPIFIALYQVLSRSIALKGAGFLWIKDLSEPDRLLKFPSQIPFLGEYLNILPILMAIIMFIQQKYHR